MNGSGRHLKYSDVESCIKQVCVGNSRFCMFDVKYELNPYSDYGDTIYDRSNPVGSRFYRPMLVRIGIKDLETHMSSDGYVLDDVVSHGKWVIPQSWFDLLEQDEQKKGCLEFGG